jgi:uncharacterized membrane protein YphA (DoxX/SURF4 family)
MRPNLIHGTLESRVIQCTRFQWAWFFRDGTRTILGAIFCAAGILKIVNSDEFVEALAAYGLPPGWGIDLVAIALPQAEILLGGLFTLGVKTKTVSRALVALLAVFTLASAIAMLQGRGGDCGCFPVEEAKERIGVWFFARNVSLIFACLWVGLTSRDARLRARAS